MPAVTSAEEENNQNSNERVDQKLWQALKRHIIRDRQRKKEAYEAEVEEERLRKEREARERQDVMTLEETKEQIDQLEQKLKQLEKEKQQLFMQLKKVLNEDEVRKRQQMKESSEMTMKMPMGNMPLPMFLPQTSGQGEPPPSQGRPPPLTSHMMNKGVKRGRSPSPTYAVPYRVSSHHHVQPMPKHQPIYTSQGHKIEDGRMGRQMTRAVLWNKPSQYNTSSSSSGGGSNVSGAGSSGAQQAGGYAAYGAPPLLYAHPGLMYPPQHSIYHMDVKHDKKDQQVQPQVLMGLSDPGYTPTTTRHVAIHPPTMPMHSNVQSGKQGGITQGYPVRQSNPSLPNPNLYPARHRY